MAPTVLAPRCPNHEDGIGHLGAWLLQKQSDFEIKMGGFILYSWTDQRVGIEYSVFADSEDEAKDALEEFYDRESLEKILFRFPPVIRPVPKGCVITTGRWLS